MTRALRRKLAASGLGAGYAYLLFGPVFAMHGSIAGSRRRKLLLARAATG